MINAKKNGFRKIYEALPKRVTTVKAPKTDFVNRIAEITMSHPTTVRAWLYGTQVPDALKQSIVSKELGIPEDELFN